MQTESRCASCKARLTCGADELAFGCSGYEMDGAERQARTEGRRQVWAWLDALVAREVSITIAVVGFVIALGYVLDACGVLGLN